MFSSRKTRRNAHVRSIRRPTQLRLETLEDRCVPATYMVGNLTDSDPGSLRQAILDANSNAGADIIQFAAGVTGTITLTSGQLASTNSVELQGPGAGVVTVSGNNACRVFYVSANVTISGLTISGGSSSDGGGIRNDGTLTVQNSTLSGNPADYGGGIRNTGTLALDGSILSGNTAPGGGRGGGIGNDGMLTVHSSTLSGNSAVGYGGGIFNSGGGTLTIDSSTLIDNAAVHQGGGIFNDRTVTVQNSTFSGNSSTPGAGIYNSNGGTLTVQNSTLRGYTAPWFNGGGIYARGASTNELP